jgi:hypothetical protein
VPPAERSRVRARSVSLPGPPAHGAGGSGSAPSFTP